MVQVADNLAGAGYQHCWFELQSLALIEPVEICSFFNASMTLADAGVHLGNSGYPVGIWFDKFSDGRGFTLARHLRENAHYADILLADGHLIPDQADYLRRCGFSHVRILTDRTAQWRLSLSLAPPAMQQVLATGRARACRDPADFR